MLGIVFAIAAAITNGLELVVHRYVVTKEHDLCYAFLWMLFSSIFFLPFFAIEYRPADYSIWALVLVSSLLWTALNLVYFKAISLLEVSSSAPLSKLKLIFVLLFSVVFLSETFSMGKLAGTMLIFLGAFISSKKVDLKGIKFSFLSSLIIAAAFIVDKFLVSFFSPGTLGFLLFLIPTIMLLPFVYKKQEHLASLLKKRLAALAGAAIFASLTYFFLLNAFKYAEASVAIPLVELNTIFSLFGAVIILRERENLLMRAMGAIAVIIGAMLIGLAIY